ncbi:MAG: tetratricopeptide repeat protein [Pirellulales bacterium]
MLLTVAVFANGVTAPFYLDDQQVLERNPTIRSFGAAWRSAPTRRVGMLSFALNYRLQGLDVRGFHVANIALHAMAGLLLFGLVRRVLGLPGMSAVLASRATAIAGTVAALWLLHPLQTGAVTYVVQRLEALMGLWFLLSLYALLRGATSSQGTLWYAVAMVAAACGAQTKEVIAVLPVVALAFDRIFLASDWRSLFRRRGWLHLGLLLCSVWIVYQMRGALGAERAGSAGFGVRSVTPWEYLSSQAGVILHYLRLTVWPSVLCLDYQWPVAQAPGEIYLPGAVILMLLALSGWALRARPAWGFLGLAFFVILAPTSSIMPIADLAFEHRMYLPLAPVVVLLVCAAVLLVERALTTPEARRLALGSAAAVVVLVCAGRTIVRNRDYADPVRMWTSVLAVNPRNYRAHNQLAIQLERRGRLDEAERHFQRTLEIRPDAWWVDIGLGNLRVRQERYEDAENHFRRALEHRAGIALASANLGRLCERCERWPEAASHYERAVQRDPGFLDAWKALAAVQLRLGNEARAREAYRAVLERDPRSREARDGLTRLAAGRRNSQGQQ